jgi:hypothetical protein
MLVRRLRSVIELGRVVQQGASTNLNFYVELKNWLYEAQKSSLPTVAITHDGRHTADRQRVLWRIRQPGAFHNQLNLLTPRAVFLSPPRPSLIRCFPKRPVFLPVFAVRHCTWVQQRVKNPRPSHPPPLPPHPISPSAQEWSENERSRISGILAQRLDKDSLAQRAGPGGAKLVYVESWKQVELANAAFG